MSLPDKDHYKDLHQGMRETFPSITSTRISEYLLQMDKAVEPKYEDMYYQRYIRCVRSAKNNDMTYVRGVVWAEVRESTAYTVDGLFDKFGVIQEAQCECGAGQGPTAHCEHVCCILLASSKFSSSGDIMTEVTCTEKLQTFHHTKAYKASPIKSAAFPAIRKRRKRIVFDPRPPKYRKANTFSRVRNVVLNNTTTRKMPIFQLFEPANPYALANDHDYLPRTMVEQFLLDNDLASVTLERVNFIEQVTMGQISSRDWHHYRKMRLTSSNFGEICKATERKNINALADRLSSVQVISTPAISHGQKYESVAVEQYEEKFYTRTRKCGVFICPEHSFLAASPDRILDENTVIEVKCPYVARNKEITIATVPYLRMNADKMTLNPRHDYHYQIQGQLLCTKRTKCHFVVFTLKDMCVVEIERDNEMIQV